MPKRAGTRSASGRPAAEHAGAVPVDGRVKRSKETVLRVTSELLGESGVSGLSIDEVSRRSGVAKSTIYRHWPTRSALVIDACARLADSPDIPATGSFSGDATALLTNVAELLKTARWSSVMPSIIDAAERDPELATIHARIQQGHTMPFRAIIARAMERGEIPATTVANALIAELLGPLFYRRFFSREALDRSFLDSLISRVLARC
jgi:AcrR family transcriptional regulator